MSCTWELPLLRHIMGTLKCQSGILWVHQLCILILIFLNSMGCTVDGNYAPCNLIFLMQSHLTHIYNPPLFANKLKINHLKTSSSKRPWFWHQQVTNSLWEWKIFSLPPLSCCLFSVRCLTLNSAHKKIIKNKGGRATVTYLGLFEKCVFKRWGSAKRTISRHVLSRTQPNGGFINYEDSIHSCYQLISKWRLVRQSCIKWTWSRRLIAVYQTSPGRSAGIADDQVN